MDFTSEDEETFRIIGAAFVVHRVHGCGFHEAVYSESLEIEFKHDGIPYEREVDLPIHYRGQRLKTTYRADFVCYGKIIVELKALTVMTSLEISQVLHYLKASTCSRALLINFGTKSLVHRRFINSKCED